jgi:hypothetical protein
MMEFADSVSGFSRIEYLSVFKAMMYTVVVSEFFIGWKYLQR